MDKKFTKGEWKFLDDGTYCEIQIEKPLLSICAINTNINEYEANAKLIAAAPEMLEMLERIQRINNIAREHISECLFEDIEQLIKKATL